MMLSKKWIGLKSLFLFSSPLLFLFIFSLSIDYGAASSLDQHSGNQETMISPKVPKSQFVFHTTQEFELPPPKPLFDKWGKPQLAILLSGELNGYFEPCGCSSNQLGGMSRRGKLAEKMKNKGWKIAGLDLGGTVKRKRRQSQMKFETILAAMKEMNYKAIGLGVAELQLGPEYLLSQHVYNAENPKNEIPFLSANVTFYESEDLGTPVRYRIFDMAGLKIGVTSILGKSVAKKVTVDDVEIKDPAKILPGLIKKMQAEKPNALILLSQSNRDESKALAKQFPQFQIILSAGGPEDPDGKVIQVNNTWILNVGRKGKHIGVLGIFPDDKKNPFRFELVTLDEKRFSDSKVMVEHMRDYQARLKDEQLAYKEIPIGHLSGSKFVGAEMCGECHTTAFDIWKKTPHAKAFESLKHPRKGMPDHKITRIHDPECLSCHVNGWHPQNVLRYKSGFVNEEFAEGAQEKERFKMMQGQQCEGCHGPGSRHIQLINDAENDTEIAKAAKLMRVTQKQAKEKVCIECHDADNSPKFDFDSFWKKVEHKGKD